MYTRGARSPGARSKVFVDYPYNHNSEHTHIFRLLIFISCTYFAKFYWNRSNTFGAIANSKSKVAQEVGKICIFDLIFIFFHELRLSCVIDSNIYLSIVNQWCLGNEVYILDSLWVAPTCGGIEWRHSYSAAELMQRKLFRLLNLNHVIRQWHWR